MDSWRPAATLSLQNEIKLNHLKISKKYIKVRVRTDVTRLISELRTKYLSTLIIHPSNHPHRSDAHIEVMPTSSNHPHRSDAHVNRSDWKTGDTCVPLTDVYSLASDHDCQQKRTRSLGPGRHGHLSHHVPTLVSLKNIATRAIERPSQMPYTPM